MHRLAFVAVALTACGTTHDDTDTTVVDSPLQLPNFYVGHETGLRAFLDQFDAKRAVYLDSVLGEVPADGPRLPRRLDVFADVRSGDYYFQVLEANTARLLSSDDLECRRVHVDGTGVIDQVYGCDGGTHVQGRDRNYYANLGVVGGGITVQLMPFADSLTTFPDTTGALMYFDIEVYPVETYPEGRVGARTFRAMPDSVCGDGVIELFEQCDDGNVIDNDGCSATCRLECGDGDLDPGEECDDANLIDGDGCSATCHTEITEPVCGNASVELGEECDDGNVADGDGCSAGCTIEPVCGNGTLEGHEECDDGNTSNMDGCSATCHVEHLCCCGDGHVDTGEQCDDGNANDGDGCSSSCSIEPVLED